MLRRLKFKYFCFEVDRDGVGIERLKGVNAGVVMTCRVVVMTH